MIGHSLPDSDKLNSGVRLGSLQQSANGWKFAPQLLDPHIRLSEQSVSLSQSPSPIPHWGQKITLFSSIQTLSNQVTVVTFQPVQSAQAYFFF